MRRRQLCRASPIRPLGKDSNPLYLIAAAGGAGVSAALDFATRGPLDPAA